MSEFLGPYLLGPNDTPENGIYTGDARELAKAIPDESVDLIFTDPPFKLSQSYSRNVDADNLLAVSSIWPLAKHWYRVAKPGVYAAIYYDTRILPLALAAMGDAGWRYLRGLTFYRRWGNAHKLYGWMSTSDFILLFRKPTDASMCFYSSDWRHDVYVKSKPEKQGFNHVAQKPLGDVCHLVCHLCPLGGVMLDTYLGSGTMAVAAKLGDRHYLAFEIDPDVAETARERVRTTQMPLFVLQHEQRELVL